MVITLADTKTKMYFPVLPEKINYQNEAYFQEYEIINKGPSKLPIGQEIAFIGWDGFLPGKNLASQPYVGNWIKPDSLHKQLETWLSKGTQLKLNITGSPLSMSCYIDSYEVTMQDAHGSLYYTIKFSKVVSIAVTSEKAKKQANKTTGTKRATKTATTKKHTVKKGDCLWNIAKKYYKSGAKWKTIYNANKSVIEAAAKKHGKKSSNNGSLIFPGTVLKIP